MATPDWQALIREKRAFRESQIPAEWRLDKKVTSQAHRDNPISAFDLLHQTNLKADKNIDTGDVEGFDASALDGAPAHVQVVGWSLRDEEVLMATEVIAEILGNTYKMKI
ncbi:hypothetical protein B0J13DRAFT_614492 [Dactylonectria estremocensis]|uniref:Amidase domain-containing protein n=1 Tax=Dactylonectria estremocensis TaxID=1079267 RepID=A0A9P9I6B4_9HYPO|nr:hypothetical protein B0J13DRAFT_614492 [Dactylonectria estremocensis]